jgi:YggT family protein
MTLLASIVQLLYVIFVILILGRVILSFVNMDYYHPVRRTIYNLTDPILEPIRRILPPASGLDFSPMVALLLAYLLRTILLSIIL